MAEKGAWWSGYVVVFVLFAALLADPVFLKDMGIADLCQEGSFPVL